MLRGRRDRRGVLEPLNSVIWSREAGLSSATSLEDTITFTTPDDLYGQPHAYITNYLKSSAIHKLGELTVQDSNTHIKLGDKSLLTLGSDDPYFDWRAGWEKVLGVGANAPRHQSGWSDEVTVEAWVLTVKNAAAPDRAGLLYPVIKGYQTNAISLNIFGLPSIQAVIDFKWKTFAKTMVWLELAFLIVWAASFSLHGLLLSNPDDLDPKGIWNVVAHACNVISLVAMLPFLLIELANIWDYALDWFSIWNVAELANCLIQIVFFVTYIRDQDRQAWVSALMATQNLLIWMRLFVLSRAVQTSKTISLVDIAAQVFVEIKDFIILATLLLWTFAFSFHVLFRMDAVITFDTISDSMLNVLKWMKSGSDLNILGKVHAHEVANYIFLIVFQVVMSMLMMSLLLGMVNRSVAKAGNDQELKAFAGQTVIMTDIETTLPTWIENLFPRSWYPKYLHILRIKPSSLTTVDSKYTWQSSRALAQAGSAVPAAAGAAAPAGDGDDVAKKLASVEAALQAQTELLQKLLASKAGNGSA